MAAASKKLAAAAVLVSLLALLAGPSAGLLGPSTGCVVFVGWPLPLLNLVNSLICALVGGNNFNPPVPTNPPPPPPPGNELSYDYYSKGPNCPGAESAVRKAVEKAINDDVKNGKGRGIGAGLIRLFFHDAFVRGCDASVLLNTTAAGNSDTEREGPPNQNSLRGFEVIDAAKEETKRVCGGNVVSCADILAFAARDASDILSGGRIKFAMPAGRFDGRDSFASETNQLPGPDSTLQQLDLMFAAQGLNTADMVTLSGAHSIGESRCLFLTDSRLKDMDSKYADDLRKACQNSDKVPLDPFSPGADPNNTLDNWYYKNIVDNKKVLFNSDAVLASPGTTKDQVEANAGNPTKWEDDFKAAMVKMGKIGVKTSRVPRVTEIREVCWKVNSA